MQDKLFPLFSSNYINTRACCLYEYSCVVRSHRIRTVRKTRRNSGSEWVARAPASGAQRGHVSSSLLYALSRSSAMFNFLTEIGISQTSCGLPYYKSLLNLSTIGVLIISKMNNRQSHEPSPYEQYLHATFFQIVCPSARSSLDNSYTGTYTVWSVCDLYN